MIKKILITLMLAFLPFIFFVKESRAVTKTSGDLEVTFDEPLFSPTTIWQPGLSVTKEMIVKNNGSSTHTVSIEAINETQTGNLADVLFIKVLEGGIDRYGGADDKSLADFWNDGEVSLSDVGAGGTATYDITVEMDASAGNDYQAKEAMFDLRVGFVGTTSQVTVSGGGGGAASPPVCGDAKPGSAPILISAVVGTNSVTLFWTAAAGPLTYYLAAYGISPGVPLYGNPDIGGLGTTGYTVSGLSGGTTYYFKIRAGNDCMPGDYSNELSAIPGGGFIAGPAAGFIPGVLGVQEETGEGEGIPSPTGPGEEEILGLEGEQWFLPSWLKILLGAGLGVGIVFILLRRLFSH